MGTGLCSLMTNMARSKPPIGSRRAMADGEIALLNR
jgi:hypothetical protein